MWRQQQSMTSDNSNQVDACIKKIFAPEKVLSLQFICMDTIIRNNEELIKHDFTEISHKHCINFGETKLLDLIATFYSDRRLLFTPFLYLFMINRRDDVKAIPICQYPAFPDCFEPLDQNWFIHLL